MGVLAPIFAAIQTILLGWAADLVLIGYGGWRAFLGIVDLAKNLSSLTPMTGGPKLRSNSPRRWQD
jgi:hypothetical protein